MRTCNLRHEIDPDLVRASVVSKVADYERKRTTFKEEAAKTLASYEASTVWSGRKPEGPGYVDPMIDGWIARERDHYAKVRVIELPQDGKRFILVYGDEDDATVGSGTGPFESFAKAEAWFTGGGR